MTSNTDIVGNKLIAEFMGDVTTDQQEWLKSDKHLVPAYCYHINWIELMDAVQKIGEYHYPNYYGARGRDHEQENDWDDCAYLRTFGMRDDEGNYMVRFNASTLIRAKTLIGATWLAVIDFISWYNKGKEDERSVARDDQSGNQKLTNK